jgi:ABC-type nickel/cobalt efflux system permease component RcnA
LFGILGLGFLLGMQHALEADQIAAVSSIAARRSEIGDIVKHGLTWELGHTLTLFLFAGAAIVLGHSIPGTLLQPLETAAGIMLVGLGALVLWRLFHDRVRFHRHTHGDGTAHIRAHSHAGEMCRTSAQPTSTRTAFAGARCWSD